MINIRKFNYYLEFFLGGIIACLSANAFYQLHDPLYLIAAGIFMLIFQKANIKLGDKK